MPSAILNPRRILKEDEDERVGGQDAWVTIEKTVRKVDEEKVQDYMDDIDTLLVFTGLYSAVLTAFLIESYKNLTADPTETLLQQLVYQSAYYRFTGGFLNTTFDVSQLPAFQVPTSAIRVNVCWFASLVISLSTASYGILVKQWLREYLAVDRTALQERLRIRHFRTQGLETWRLFDIAAILPMFLQLALTLFLVGLCFFTAAVHESIGRTSLILVSAWAFFLSLAVLAPLISARCPYKTTFLKAAFRQLRPHARSLGHQSVIYFRALVIYTRSHPAIVMISGRFFKPCVQFVVSIWAQLSLGILAVLHQCRILRANSASVPHSIISAEEPLRFDAWIDSIRRPDNLFHKEYMALFAETTLNDPTGNWQEESTLRSDESADLIIFRDVDAIFLDDRILAMMREALQRRPPPGEDVLKFVLEILEHRSDSVFCGFDNHSAEPEAWPWALSNNARTTLVDIMTDSLLVEVSKTSVRSWYRRSSRNNPHGFWMDQALSLLFALSAGESDLPQSMSSALKGWLQVRDRDGLFYICLVLSYQLKVDLWGLPKHISTKWQIHLLAHLLVAFQSLPIEDAAQAFSHIGWLTYDNLTKLADTDPPRHTDELPSAIGHHDGEEPEQAQHEKVSPLVILTLLDTTAGILNFLTVAQTNNPEGEEPAHDTAFPESVQDLMDLVFQAIPFIQKTLPEADLRSALPISRVDLERLIWTLFTATTPCHTIAFLDFWSERPKKLQAHLRPDQFLVYMLKEVFSLTDNDDAVAFLSACARSFDSKLSSNRPLQPAPAIRLGHLVYLVPTSTDEDVLRAWHTVFASIVKCIDRISPNPVVQEGQEQQLPHCLGGDHTDACSAAFALLAELDADRGDGCQSGDQPDRSGPGRKPTDYAAWSTAFQVEESQMPDEMVKALLRFTCEAHTKDDEGRTFWRVRRLQDLEASRDDVEMTTGQADESIMGERLLSGNGADEVLCTGSSPIASLYPASTPAPSDTELVAFTERTNDEGSELPRSSSRTRAETALGETARMDSAVMESGAEDIGD